MSAARAIRRILVALDASPTSPAVAESAALLARLLEAELTGLFVEDVQLVRAAALPLAREIDIFTATLRRSADTDLLQHLRRQQSAARHGLQRHAERARVTWSFRVARGSVSAEISEAASSFDLIGIGREGWTIRNRQRLGSTLRQLITERRRRILLLDEVIDLQRPVVTCYNGTDAADDALDLATQLSRSGEGSLTVLMSGESEVATAREVRARLGAAAESAHLRWLPDAAEENIARVALAIRAGVLVYPTSSDEAAAERIQTLLGAATCPVLIVT